MAAGVRWRAVMADHLPVAPAVAAALDLPTDATAVAVVLHSNCWPLLRKGEGLEILPGLLTIQHGVRPDDMAFCNSPPAGQPGCRCSRCGQAILSACVPVRLPIQISALTDVGWLGEYRYHPDCLGLPGIDG